MSYTCSVYGLGIECNAPIAALMSLMAPCRVDVRISLGEMPPELSMLADTGVQPYYISPERNQSDQPELEVRRLLGDRFFHLRYSDEIAIAVAAHGNAVWATWPRTQTLEDAAAYVLGPTLGFVLRLRGVTCLHASAIAIDDKAIAMVGPSGTGKSSTAAGLAQLGYPVLTDDVLALADHSDQFDVQPAYPRLRLWPESAASLFGSAEALPRITPGWDKRFLDLNGHTHKFQRSPLPLAAVYLLCEHDAGAAGCVVEEVSPRAALMDLVANTHANYLHDSIRRAQEFELLGRLVENVPTRRVRHRLGLDRIREVCSSIIEDFQR